MAESDKKKKVVFQMVEHIGIIATYKTGWTKELNVVAWNDGPAKFDIRDWNEDHDHMGRGVTLHADEAQKLMELLNERFSTPKAEPRQEENIFNGPADGVLVAAECERGSA
jgi:hypothetical protein